MTRRRIGQRWRTDFRAPIVARDRLNPATSSVESKVLFDRLSGAPRGKGLVRLIGWTIHLSMYFVLFCLEVDCGCYDHRCFLCMPKSFCNFPRAKEEAITTWGRLVARRPEMPVSTRRRNTRNIWVSFLPQVDASRDTQKPLASWWGEMTPGYCKTVDADAGVVARHSPVPLSLMSVARDGSEGFTGQASVPEPSRDVGLQERAHKPENGCWLRFFAVGIDKEAGLH